MNSSSIQPCIVALICSIFHVWGMERARADYNSYTLLTVEWLVDNSDTILIARADGEEDAGSVVEVIKGDSSSFNGSLSESSAEQMGLPRVSILRPPQDGKLKLHFIRQGVSLQSVGLGRNVRMERELHLQNMWYGVTQFEQVLLDPSSLLHAIRQRLKADTSADASTEVQTPETILVDASVNFPFESTDELFQLAVPSTREWRVHYIEILSSGDALQRIEAMSKLKAFGNAESFAAKQAAVENTKDIPNGYRQVWMSSKENPVVTEKDVRKQGQPLRVPITK